MKNTTSKYIQIFLFVGVLGLSISCNKKNDTPSTDESTAPETPTDLSVIVKSNGTSATLSWKAPGAGKIKDGSPAIISEYEINTSKTSDFADASKKNSKTTSLDISNLEESTTYYFRVKAKNSADKESSYSDAVSALVQIPSIAPDKPTGLSSIDGTLSTNGITLRWTAPENTGRQNGNTATISQYKVEWSKNNNFSEKMSMEVSSSNTQMTISELTASTPYFSRVFAANGTGDSKLWSPASETFQFTTNSPPPTTDESTAPETPTDLSVIVKSNGTSATLSWKAPGAGKIKDGSPAIISEYEINTSKTSDFADASKKNSKTTSLDISNLEESTTYYFRVKAKNSADKESSYSDAVSTLVQIPSIAPDKPTGLSSIDGTLSTNGITLRWTAPENTGRQNGNTATISQYKVEWSKNNNFSEKMSMEVSSSNTQMTISELTASTPYFSRVFAANGTGDSKLWSPASETFQFTTNSPPPTPDPIENEATYAISIEFNWTSTNHPSNLGGFPSSAHFSPLVVSTHKNDKSFYKRGEIASTGVKIMAETGGTSTLSSEIDNQISQNNAFKKLIGGGFGASGTKNFGTIEASGDFHYISMVSMIAPSPDWFIAKRNVTLKNLNGDWLNTVTFELRGYDSGTDSGEMFTSSNLATNPKENIKIFTGEENIVFATATLTKQ